MGARRLHLVRARYARTLTFGAIGLILTAGLSGSAAGRAALNPVSGKPSTGSSFRVLSNDGPTTGILDNFNRADETPLSGGGNWAPLGSQAANLRNMGVEGGGGAYWTTAFGPETEAYLRSDDVAFQGVAHV